MNNVIRATISLMVITIVSKILGFGRELVLSFFYGASTYSDIYIMSMNIPIIIFDIIGIAISTTFIPLYYENYKIGGDYKGFKFTNNIFNISLILGIVISIICYLTAEYLVRLFAIGFEGEQLRTAITFTRIMIFGGVFIGIRNIMTSLLQIKEKFIISALTGLPFNIIIILSIILSQKYTIYILPVGTLIAIASQFIFQYPFARMYGYKYECFLDVKDEYVKKMIWLIAPVFLGVVVNQFNTMIDRTIASTLIEGSISSLNYANKLNLFVMGIFITSIGTIIYPMLSKLSSNSNSTSYLNVVTKSINIVIMLVIPISVGAIVLSKPIVKILFQRGAFDEQATMMTATALVFYSIGMVAFGLRDILGKVFYSMQDTKTPMVNGAFAILLNIILNLILVKFMGHAGLALATSASAIICIFLLFNSLKKKVGYFGQDKITKTTYKSVISAIVMGFMTSYVYNIMSNVFGLGFASEVLSLLGSIGVGIIVYSVLIIIMKVEEIDVIIEIIKKKFRCKT